ncbi:MAG: dihydroneopterin triphosphate diphosphatase [Pseudomonadota bacterium]|nr:dihydroneopterin triphosphate diphosphatase [Gammaproteobacteria bacterium]MEE2683748.1 dihydroneopterin triphosphate diphosphatase [Pseudomonadota bacterium]|tara:strand:+ start:786 stop:1217 length:432 start_codon:yes stop_codon:yes gene_type:complete
MPNRLYRRPESVLVVIYTFYMDFLLLERTHPVNFWQSVTGTICWNEDPHDAAIREVKEETGLSSESIIDAKLKNKFSILPEWKDRYDPKVNFNTEHLWYLKIPQKVSIDLCYKEHKSYKWVKSEQALKMVQSWTNKEAIKRLL